MADNAKARRYLATCIRRLPGVASYVQNMVRYVQGRFTIGAVGVLLDTNERILLVEHVFHPEYPWGFPGGWASRNEMPQQTVVREFKEETNLDINTIQPLIIWQTNRWRNHINLAFLVELTNPAATNTITLSNELLAYQWACRDSLPPMLPEHINLVDLAIKFYRENNQCT